MILALTSGEPAGIGPDLCLQQASHWPALLTAQAIVVVLGDHSVFAQRARQLGMDFSWPAYPAANKAPVQFLHLPTLAAPVHCGEITPANGPHVLSLLDRANEGCLRGEFSAMVTAPVHKEAINQAGMAFTGHTEYLAQKSNTARVVMMLVGGGLRVALATTHLPLSQVSAAITAVDLRETIRILHHDLISRFHLARPRILVAGLNPHAGEGGYLGREEIDIITPVLDQLRREQFDLIGPLPADTLFTPGVLKGSDAQLAMYHDQGLSVLKFASFGQGVNITLGLPYVRTSVDHGTALSLAGTGRADGGSLNQALQLALHLAAPH